MTDLDALKGKWAEHDRKLDVNIRLNRQLLLAMNAHRVTTPLHRFAFLAGLGAAVGLIGLVILGQFLYLHWAEPRFALPAALLHLWLIAMVSASIRQMAMALRIGFDEPITVVRKQVESLRALRIRVTQWALLTGQLVWWIPFLVVALKGVWNVDAYQVLDTKFLVANVALGIAIIPLAIWASRRFGDRMGSSPTIQRLMRTLAGYNLNAAAVSLAGLAEFVEE